MTEKKKVAVKRSLEKQAGDKAKAAKHAEERQKKREAAQAERLAQRDVRKKAKRAAVETYAKARETFDAATKTYLEAMSAK